MASSVITSVDQRKLGIDLKTEAQGLAWFIRQFITMLPKDNIKCLLTISITQLVD